MAKVFAQMIKKVYSYKYWCDEMHMQDHDLGDVIINIEGLVRKIHIFVDKSKTAGVHFDWIEADYDELPEEIQDNLQYACARGIGAFDSYCHYIDDRFVRFGGLDDTAQSNVEINKPISEKRHRAYTSILYYGKF